METPATPSGTSAPKPAITYSAGIPHLTSVQEKLLEQQFHDRKPVHVEKQFNAGYSGATPYLLAFPASNYEPVVAKFDHPVILRRERAAYVKTIKGKLGVVAPNQDELIESEDGSSGLLVYSYVGITIAETQSYGEYLEKSKDNHKAINVLNRIFLYGLGKWMDGKGPERISRQKYYDRLLPPHLHLTAIEANLPTPEALQAGKLEQTQIAKLTVGQLVQLVGFKVHKSAEDGLTLYDELSPKVDGAPIRLKLKGVQAVPGDELPALSAVITATRNDLLDALARDALPTFTIHTESFTAYGCTFPNPLRYCKTLLDQRYEAKVAIMHGDLHLQNILLDKFDHPWLIDFAKTGEGPVLFDLQYLEARILTTLLFDSKTPLPKCVKQLNTVLEALRHETLPASDDPDTAKTPRGIDRNTYLVLVGVRRLARRYLAKDTDWCEYYCGLTLALLQLLKFSDYEQSTRQLALIGAAITIQWAGIKAVKPVHCPTRPWFLWATAGLLAVLLALSVLGWYHYPNLLRDTEPRLGTIATPQPVYYPLAKPVAGCTRTVDEIRAQALPTPAPAYTSIVQRVRDRGVLLCGVEGGLPKFSLVNDREIPNLPGFFADVSGIDADYCRVVATSIFGDYAGRVAFTKLITGERFNALFRGDIDLLIRNTTWTIWRDTTIVSDTKGINFGPVIFYDGQRFLVNESKAKTISTLEDLKGETVCVQSDTTTLKNTMALSKELALNLEIKSDYPDTKAVIGAYVNGECTVMAGDTSQLATRNDTVKGKIMPDAPISFEPLAPVMVENSEWHDIVNNAIWATIYAEELGVTRGNVDEAKDKSPLMRQQFLSSGNEIGQALGLGENSNFIHNIITQFGNYGEIYACNLGEILPDRGQNQPALWYDFSNQSWLPNPGGLLISPPLGLE